MAASVFGPLSPATGPHLECLPSSVHTSLECRARWSQQAGKISTHRVREREGEQSQQSLPSHTPPTWHFSRELPAESVLY